MASLPPVSPGSLPEASSASVGHGSAGYDIEADLAAQMEQSELAETQTMSHENGGYAEPPGGDDGDEEEYEEEYGGQLSHSVSTFDASAYTAHQEYIRAASHFVSPMGYDQHSPSDWPGNAPSMAPAVTASNAPDYSGESVMDAFMRQSAAGASSMGYDVFSPNGVPDYAYPLGPLSVGSQQDAVEMSDSTKRGRGDPPSPAPSSERPPPKRSATPASPGAAVASVPSAPAPRPSQDPARLQALTYEVSALQHERDGLYARTLSAESAAQASIQSSAAAVLAVRAQLADCARQAEAHKLDSERRHAEQLAELRAEAANFRAQSEAQVASMLDGLRVTAEARHGEAMARAESGFAAREAAREAQHALAAKQLLPALCSELGEFVTGMPCEEALESRRPDGGSLLGRVTGLTRLWRRSTGVPAPVLGGVPAPMAIGAG